MCIIAFQYTSHSLTVIANRDEFYQREALPLQRLTIGQATVYCGIDKEAGGTWLGANEFGQFAAVTNVRIGTEEKKAPRSRGTIPLAFLQRKQSAQQFVQQLQRERTQYGPFNVILYDQLHCVHYNNVTDVITILPHGYHVLSNATINSSWPKTASLKQAFIHAMPEQYFTILLDSTKAAIDDLPQTGIPLTLEQELSSIFIALPHYGTRCSTIYEIASSQFAIKERTYDKGIFAFDTSFNVSLHS